jgi:hypothetical protein
VTGALPAGAGEVAAQGPVYTPEGNAQPNGDMAAPAGHHDSVVTPDGNVQPNAAVCAAGAPGTRARGMGQGLRATPAYTGTMPSAWASTSSGSGRHP